VTKARKQSPGSKIPHDAHRLPKPVFHDPKHDVRIYQGDCLDVMASLPEESIDLIFADPPYFLSNDGITCQAGKMVSVNKGDWDKSNGADQNHEFNRLWLAACQRLLTPNGSIWVSGTSHVIHSIGYAMQQLEFKLLNDITWIKPNPPPNLSCRYFTHATETIIWAAKNKKSRHTFNYAAMRQDNGGKQMKSAWTLQPPRSTEKRFGKHPAQKPVDLLDRIIRASSSEDSLLFDPFAGSGTLAVAALRSRRRVFLCEMDDGFIDLALARICSELVQVAFSVFFDSFPLDLLFDPMDRSDRHRDDMPADSKLVFTECRFHFIGRSKRQVIFSVLATSLDRAWDAFRASDKSHEDAIFVVRTSTDIFLTQ
jgi:site-specific DNA-methyltransferase (adenine-specific)